ncbi:MAG: FtsX-like permease family protein [Thermoproteota archaeon]|nr:FtsX-like permease family protein [Candidatus Brockarchaeota archaeon]
MMKSLSKFCKAILSIVVIVLVLSHKPFSEKVIFASGSIIFPATIYLEGRLESGSIADGIILITSGIVVLENLVLKVSATPIEGFNYVETGSGKMKSTIIILEKGYLMRLSAVYAVDANNANTMYVAFGYGDDYEDSTTIWHNSSYSYMGILFQKHVFINATGVLSFSEGHVTILAQGNAITPGWGEENLEGCLLTVRKGFRAGDEVFGIDELEFWISGWADEDYYYIPIPKGETVSMLLRPQNKIATLLNMLEGTTTTYAESIKFSCNMKNISIPQILLKRMSRSLKLFLSREQGFFQNKGFDVGKYFSEFDYVSMLLEESNSSLEKGDLEVGVELLRKAVIKADMALEALSQAKTDCIAMFLFLIAFTFFLSSFVGTLFERKRAFVSVLLFIVFTITEIACIPQIRMAASLLNPEAMAHLTPFSLALSLSMAFETLLLLGILLFEFKGTFVSDLFWYSFKSMRRRALRAILTIVTIAVVSAVAGSLLAVGTIITTREEAYPSEFHGLSISAHVTTLSYQSTGGSGGGGGFQGYESEYTEFFEPIPEWQVKWLSSMKEVERTYVVTATQAVVSKKGMGEEATLVATNSLTMEGVMISASLADALGVKEGDSITIMAGEKVMESRVVKVLKEPLKLLDGVPLDEVEAPLKIISGAPRPRRKVHMVVIGLDLLQQTLPVYRLVLQGKFSSDFAKRLVETSYEKSTSSTDFKGRKVVMQIFKSLRVCFSTGNETRSLLIVGEFQQFASIPEIIIPIGLSSLTIFIALLGSLYERQKEYSTMSALGASPGRVSLLMFVEGLTYGLIGGVLGYVFGQFLQMYVPNPVSPVKPYVFSAMMASLIVAVVPSVFGSIVPARKAVLQVVPSKILLKKAEDTKFFRDRAEAAIPLRITGDSEDFAAYVSSLTKRPPPLLGGPVYMQTSLIREGGRIKTVEMVLSYRGNRVVTYRINLLLPESPHSTIKAIVYPADGKWKTDHKHCTREMLTALREDLLQYVEWKKQTGKA